MTTDTTPQHRHLQPGDMAPEFTLSDAEGRSVSLRDLRDRRVVLYVYPKASTPGCTTEACGFRDNLTILRQNGYEVLGISPDRPEALRAFRDEHGLPFPLLSDPDRAAIRAYGAYGPKVVDGETRPGVIRSTFLVDGEGRLTSVEYDVTAAGHVDRVVAALVP